MRRVIVFVGDYDPYQQYFPLAGQMGAMVVVFVDRRNVPSEIQRVVEAAIPLTEIAGVEVVRTAPSTPEECSSGIHWWEPLERDGQTIGATCRHCSAVEHLHPLGAPVAQGPVKVSA